MKDEQMWAAIRGGSVAVVLTIGVVCLSMWGCPKYNVYREGMAGEAKLREAESSRQVVVEEAKAKRESAKMLAEAEIERAKGVAEANRIVGESLKDNQEYLLYLWIQELSTNGNNVIYIPTEAGLPILEAGRFLRQMDKKTDKKTDKK